MHESSAQTGVRPRRWRVQCAAGRARPASRQELARRLHGIRESAAAIDAHVFGGFPRGMRELGDIEGKNFAIEWRFADDKRDRLPELAAELVRLKVDVIVASASAATIAAQSATSTIPIVFAAVNDPVSQGMVKSLLWRQPDRRFPSSGYLRGQDIQGRQTE